MSITTIDYVRQEIFTLSTRVDNLTAEEIKESLAHISNDLLDISHELYCHAQGIKNRTGLTEEEYREWYNNVRIPEILCEGMTI